jgi:TP53 regulating kinase-like protein
MEEIARGAESIIYAAAIMGREAILKRRVRKRYRIEALDLEIRASRARREAKIMALAGRAGIGVPVLLLFDGYDIYMSPVAGERLDTLIMNGGFDARMLEGVGAALWALHRIGIAHGDYTPANIMIEGSTPYIIDFGLSEVTESVEEKALDVLLMKRSLSQSQYRSFIKGYTRGSTGSRYILRRLEGIERRGRYQTRTLAV